MLPVNFVAAPPEVASPVVFARQLLLACLPAAPGQKRLAVLLGESPDWQELQSQGERHGLLPLVYQALKQCPEELVPAAELNRLRGWFAAHALRSLQMHRELLRLIDLLTAEQIAVIPYKGPILAEEAYGDIALRSYNDLDLLVPPEQAWAAVQLLLAQGYLLDFALPQDRWTSLLKLDNHLYLQHAEQSWGVEIHWQLFNPMYLLPFDLSAHWAALEGGGEGRLEREETLVMLCAHGTKHLWHQLKWLADVDRLLRNGPPLNWQRVLFVARHAAATRCLLLGLQLARRVFGTPLDGEMVAGIDADPVVGKLAEDVLANLFPENPENRQFLGEFSFHMRSRERMNERYRQILRWLFWPRLADWLVFPAGDQCFWLYYIERPLRMVWKWVLSPFFQKRENQ